MKTVTVTDYIKAVSKLLRDKFNIDFELDLEEKYKSDKFRQVSNRLSQNTPFAFQYIVYCILDSHDALIHFTSEQTLNNFANSVYKELFRILPKKEYIRINFQDCCEHHNWQQVYVYGQEVGIVKLYDYFGFTPYRLYNADGQLIRQHNSNGNFIAQELIDMSFDQLVNL